ncbi:ATP synthase F1 subunit gamma [Melioribacteraceae bacterium 4301-Me]|uniref:ATP synthase F1 subunit gamma n=1 Tax=Pyranulibacter aquaticus TaxID=3163344 RepID=UPI00359B630D
MATLRDIKRRITGVSNIQQITRAMKMIAAVQLRKAQENIINARPYARKINEVINHLLSVEKNVSNELLQQRKYERVAIVVITSDRGMCGAFNMNVIRTVEELVSKEYKEFYNNKNLELYCVGKKGFDYFSKRNYLISESYLGLFSHLNFESAVKIVHDLKLKYLNHQFDNVILVFNEFKSVIQQNILIEQLLPIKPGHSINNQKFVDYIYEPNKIEIINSLLPKKLNIQLWRALLESFAAELGARMTAMDMATENAKELIRTLRLTYNKERQASITKEIIEIVSGANAMKES